MKAERLILASHSLVPAIAGLGIDLGSYNSAAAYSLDGQQVLQVVSSSGTNFQGKNFPSFVKFNATGLVEAVGETARNALVMNPRQVVWGVKRLVGLSYSAAMDDGELARFAYPIERGPGDSILIPQGSKGTKYTPESVLREILAQIKADAKNSYVNPLLGGKKIEGAVITVPAYFSPFRVNLIIQAGRDAGFVSVKTIPEPVAAARRFGLKINGEARVFAFDLGAGTLDVTVFRIKSKDGRWLGMEVSTQGSPSFGGIDIDDVFMRHVTSSSPIGADPLIQASVRDCIERTKILLSERTEASIDMPGRKSVMFSRDQLDTLITPLLKDRCSGSIRVALKLASVGGERAGPKIDYILLVGGPTKMPCVRKYLRNELATYGFRPEVLSQIDTSQVDAMNSVSEGAALQFSDNKVHISLLPHSYGTKGFGGRYEELTPVNTPYPCNAEVVLQVGSGKDFVVHIPMIMHGPDTANTVATNPPDKWISLGYFRLAVVPDGRPHVIRLHFHVDENRLATVTLQRLFETDDGFSEMDPKTGRVGEKIPYVRFDDRGGEEIAPLVIAAKPRLVGLQEVPAAAQARIQESNKKGAKMQVYDLGASNSGSRVYMAVVPNANGKPEEIRVTEDGQVVALPKAQSTSLSRGQIEHIIKSAKEAMNSFVAPALSKAMISRAFDADKLRVMEKRIVQAIDLAGRTFDTFDAVTLVNAIVEALQFLRSSDSSKAVEIQNAEEALFDLLP